MSKTLYTIEEAAEKMNVSINAVYQLAINGDLRMGVNARNWLGMWFPTLPEDEAILAGDKFPVPEGVNDDGFMVYTHSLSDGTKVELTEFLIHHFWYITYSELYSLLTSRGRSPRQISSLEPTAEWHKEALNINPSIVTKHGFFLAILEYDGNSQDLSVGLDDLLIVASDLPESTKRFNKQSQREVALNKLIAEYGLESLVPLGRKGVWNKLRETNPHLFSSSESTITKFYEKQKIIAFKAQQ